MGYPTWTLIMRLSSMIAGMYLHALYMHALLKAVQISRYTFMQDFYSLLVI